MIKTVDLEAAFIDACGTKMFPLYTAAVADGSLSTNITLGTAAFDAPEAIGDISRDAAVHGPAVVFPTPSADWGTPNNIIEAYIRIDD